MSTPMDGYAVVDRFEGDSVILEVGGEQVTRPRRWLAQDAREGDVVALATGQVDRKRTEALRQEEAKARAQTKRVKPGDFDL